MTIVRQIQHDFKILQNRTHYATFLREAKRCVRGARNFNRPCPVRKHRLGGHLAHYACFVMISQRLFTAIMRVDQTAVIQAIQV